MSYGKGFAVTAGAKQSSVWGTPVELGAGNQFEFLSESLTPDAQLIPDEQVSGVGQALFGDKGNEMHSGDLEMDLKYEGLGLFLAMGMGSTSATPAQQSTDDAYKHVIAISDTKEGKHITVALNKGVAIWEYTTCKVGGLSISCNKGERAKLKVPLIPQGLNFNTSTGTNNNTTMANLTLPSNRDFALFRQMVVRINDVADGALANADLIYISNFSVDLNNNMPSDDVTTQYGYLVSEPIQDGNAEITGSIDFSVYNNSSPGGNHELIQRMISKGRMKMDVTFTGPVADGGTNFSLQLIFPDVQFETGEAPVSGRQRIPTSLKFRANRALAAPTGMSYTDAMTIELVNQVSSALMS